MQMKSTLETSSAIARGGSLGHLHSQTKTALQWVELNFKIVYTKNYIFEDICEFAPPKRIYNYDLCHWTQVCLNFHKARSSLFFKNELDTNMNSGLNL